MAGDPIVLVRQQLADQLAPLMPQITDGIGQVPVNYAWPGQAQEREHVWTEDGDSPVSVPTMRAGRKRREVQGRCRVVVEVVMVGRQLDAAGASVLQLACDQRREEIATVITDWLADDPLLGFGDRTVDWAEVSLIQRSGGPTENGAGSRAVIEITYQARLL